MRATPILIVFFLCGALVLAGCASLGLKREKESPGSTAANVVMASATVEAIDLKTGTVSLKGPTGMTATIQVGDNVSNLDQLKVGDVMDLVYQQEEMVCGARDGHCPPTCSSSQDPDCAAGGWAPTKECEVVIQECGVNRSDDPTNDEFDACTILVRGTACMNKCTDSSACTVQGGTGAYLSLCSDGSSCTAIASDAKAMAAVNFCLDDAHCTATLLSNGGAAWMGSCVDDSECFISGREDALLSLGTCTDGATCSVVGGVNSTVSIGACNDGSNCSAYGGPGSTVVVDICNDGANCGAKSADGTALINTCTEGATCMADKIYACCSGAYCVGEILSGDQSACNISEPPPDDGKEE
ncbi:MAG: copper-binding protein [Deltaproteobacteria bacterium]|nr:copper-binding protein [Deltaproteobacteria bacterium]